MKDPRWVSGVLLDALDRIERDAARLALNDASGTVDNVRTMRTIRNVNPSARERIVSLD
jgi:hypothetical protein